MSEFGCMCAYAQNDANITTLRKRRFLRKQMAKTEKYFSNHLREVDFYLLRFLKYCLTNRINPFIYRKLFNQLHIFVLTINVRKTCAVLDEHNEKRGFQAFPAPVTHQMKEKQIITLSLN